MSSKAVSGNYIATTALVATTNTISVQVNITTAGNYTIYTDTVNGYYFRSSGAITATGINTIILKGNGTPLAAGTNTFSVHYGATTCNIDIPVLPAGTTPSVGVGTLVGAGATCTTSTVNGTYTVSAGVGSSNTVTVQVNVTAIGSYNISSNTVSGFSFSGTGNFTATGVQSVILSSTGTPTTAGAQTFTITYGGANCSVVVTVVAAGGGTSSDDYFPRTANSNWSYDATGFPEDSFLIHVVSPSLTAAGNTYAVFLSDNGVGDDSSGNYRKSGSDYYEYGDAALLFAFP